MTDYRDMHGRTDGGAQEEEDLLGPDLRALLSSLPRELAPESDLTASIASRTWDSRRKEHARSTNVLATNARAVPTSWWSGQGLKLAAAAVVLVVVTSLVTAVLVREQVNGPNGALTTVVNATNSSTPRLTAGFAAYADVESQYAAAIADLTRALEADRDRLPRATVDLIEENLRIIDQAIQQSLHALQSAPQSLPLQQALVTSYERKLDFLRQAAAITAEG